jgi:hypothetical protein
MNRREKRAARLRLFAQREYLMLEHGVRFALWNLRVLTELQRFVEILDTF